LNNKENPSEGWCDWLAAILTIKPDDTGTTPRPIATYLLGQGPNGDGVRPYPYSTKISINPLTYASLPSTVGRHRIGAIWGEIIWEMTWSLIDEFGFDPNIYNFTGDINQDAGNIMAMAIVTEGLKFTPCRPGFVDARDGIIMAAQEIYGDDVICTIWEAFVKRGLGYYANQGSPEITTDGTASFISPFVPSFQIEVDTFCFESGIYELLSGGFPLGGTYNGPGVVDNGDGRTFNFDPMVAGVGVHTITYYLSPTICYPASEISTSTEITVKEDILPPQLECLPDVSLNFSIGEVYFLGDFTGYIIASDNCPGDIDLIQTPSVGTLINSGDTEITITARDRAGNEASCTFQLTISFNSEIQIEQGFLTFYPNPSKGELTVFNPKEKKINTIEIRDMQGRYISQILINNSERENNISVETLASGVYFITVNLANEIKVLRLVKS